MSTILTDDERNRIIDSMGWSLDAQERGDMHRLIQAVLAKLARQEPVAQWQKRHPLRTENQWENTHEHDAKWWRDNSQGWEIRALYTHPAPPQADRQRVPEGWKLVPVEPTQEMCKAAVIYANGNAVYKNVAAAALEIEEGIYGEAYTAMLAAAPEAPAQADRQRVPDGWQEAVKVAREARNPDFLGWLADRLVHVYGESANVDFVLCLRRMAATDRAALAQLDAMLAAAPEAPAQNGHLADDERVAALCTLSYAAGMKAGWNYCASEDNEGFERSQKSVGEAIRILKAHRAAAEAPAQASAVDEREAFEAWLGIKPCGAAHEFGWAAWQARAAMTQKGGAA